MKNRLIKIGELADKIGLTVRTIRYYDEIGLLSPAERSRSGYRLYGLKELEQLQKIRSLTYLGFQLEEVKNCLENPEYNLSAVIHRQMEQIHTEIELGQKLYRRLEKIVRHLNSSENPSTEELIETLKTMVMYEKYYTKEQLDYLEQRKQEIGEARIKEVQHEWKQLIDRVGVEMEKGSDPNSDTVQKLAARWEALIRDFTGGNPGIRKSLVGMYKNENPEKVSRGFVDSEVMNYMDKAMKHKKDIS